MGAGGIAALGDERRLLQGLRRKRIRSASGCDAHYFERWGSGEKPPSVTEGRLYVPELLPLPRVEIPLV